MRPALSEDMKWVLLFGLVVGVAYGRTIFDYEKDGLDNEQEGLPGKSVSGQYEWRAPDGKVTEISYVADHLGFRLVDDPEIQAPSEPWTPSESTAQTSIGEEEEEEEEEEGGEEEESGTEESETEETEEEDSNGQEGEETEEKGVEEEETEEAGAEEEGEEEEGAEEEGGEEEEAEEKTGEAKTAETDGAESTNAEDEEADSSAKETDAETKSDDNKGKSFDENATEEQETADNTEETKKADVPKEESAIDSSVSVEVKTVAEPAPVLATPTLVPVKVESTFVEEVPVAVERTFIEEVPVAVEPTFVGEVPVAVEPTFVEQVPIAVGPTFVGEAPVIATAELYPAVEPMVAPFSAFEVMGEIVADPVFPSAVPVSAPEELSVAMFASDQQLVSSPVDHTVDNYDTPSAVPGTTIALLGPFPAEVQETSQVFDYQNEYDREVRTPVVVTVQEKDFSSDPTFNPAVELESVKVPIASFPRTEAFQQPSIEVSPTLQEEQMPVTFVEVNEVPSSPENLPFYAFENSSPESRIVSRHIEVVDEPEPWPSQNFVTVNEVPQAVSVIQVQESSSVPASEPMNNIPQQIELIQITPEIQESSVDPPLPSPLPQVQIFEYDFSSASVEGSPESNPILDQNPATVVFREVQVSEANERPYEGFAPAVRQVEPSPTIEIELPQHRFQVTKLGHSMDSDPVRVDNIDNNPIKDLYFIPESFQVSDFKPSQSSVQYVEIPAPVPEEELIIKAKSFSQPEVAGGFEIVGASANELEKPTYASNDPSNEYFNLIPIGLSAYVDPNQKPLQREAPFIPEQKNIFQEPIQFVEVPASAFYTPESPQSDATMIPVADLPAAYPKPLPDNVVFIESSEPSYSSAGETASYQTEIQGPPLLPPLMKMSRILN